MEKWCYVKEILQRSFQHTEKKQRMRTRKLIQRIKEIYVGMTEDIDAERKNDSQTQPMKPQFKNKPPLKPIQADCPMAINQVDIVDLCAFPSTHKGPPKVLQCDQSLKEPSRYL